MTDALNNETALFVSNLTSAALQPVQIEKTHHIVVPHGHQRIDLTGIVEQAEPAPYRKKGAVALGDVASLLTYCKDQGAQATGYIYADVDGKVITAVFNDAKAGPGWRDHKATYKAELTPEMQKWLKHDTHHFGQSEFAEFIEDNFEDLNGEEAQSLLVVATTIAAATSINFGSAKRLQDGQTQLIYNETIDAKAGADGQMRIPKTFDLAMLVFKGAPAGEAFKARLKYRLHSGSVKFWYELDRPEKVIDAAFGDYVKLVSEQSGYTVLTGKA